MAHNEVSKSKYLQERVDTSRMAILFLERIWIVLLGIAAGIVAGILIYFVYHFAADGIMYSAYSEFYLDFATDETGEVYQYYNGYTWNDLMTTDLIAEYTLSELTDTGVDLSRLEADTLAEIKSDIRVLKVTITDSDENLCAQILDATEKSLVNLGKTRKEFNDISIIKSIKPKRIYADNRLPQAIELGAIIGLLLSLILLWFAFIADDRIMTPTDLYGLDVDLLGVSLQKTDEKLANALSILQSANEAKALNRFGISDFEKVMKVEADRFLEEAYLNDHLTEINQSEGVIIMIPYASVKKSNILLMLDTLRLNQIKVIGCTITGADNRFYKVYYGLNGLLRK